MKSTVVKRVVTIGWTKYRCIEIIVREETIVTRKSNDFIRGFSKRVRVKKYCELSLVR